MTPLKALHWKQKPVPELVRLAWPTTVSMLSFSVMTLVDTLFVGRLGARELAAVSLGGVLSFTLICFGFGVLRSTKLSVSQSVGAGRSADVPAITTGAVWLALGLGVLTIALGRLAVGHVAALGPDPVSGAWAADYLSIRNLGAPLFLVAVALRESSYGTGNARRPMVATLWANGSNVALDALFIFGFGWGVNGAAWATVGACLIEALVLLATAPDGTLGRATPRLRELSRLIRFGIPLGLQFLLEVGSFAVLVVLLARTSERELAAHQIAMQLVHFSFLPALALGEAASILTGQAVGANQDVLVRRLARIAFSMASVYAGVCAVVFVLGASFMPSWFSPDPEVQAIARQLLYIAAAFQLADAANVVARCVLRGTGDVRYPAILAVSIAWVLTPTSTWYLGIHLGFGAVGAWLGLCAEIMLGAGLLWWRLERGGWQPLARESRARLAALEPSPVLA